MNIQRKERKKLFILMIAMLIIATISLFNRVLAMKDYQEIDFSTGIVTASALNVRQGPSLSYKIISKVYKNEYIRVFAKIDNWYVVQTDNDIIGTVYASYVKPIYEDKQTNAEIIENQSEDNDLNEEDKLKVTTNENVLETEGSASEKIANVAINDKINSTELTNDEKEILNAINQKREEAGLRSIRNRRRCSKFM